MGFKGITTEADYKTLMFEKERGMIVVFGIIGYVIMFIGVICLIVKCFQEHVAWEICSIFFPGITWLAFLICHPGACWKPTITYMTGIACILLPFVIYAAKPEIIVAEAAVITAMSTEKKEGRTIKSKFDLLPYRTVHSNIKPVTIQKVPLRQDDKIKYYDITFHDYFLEERRISLFAIKLNNESGLLSAKTIDKDLCDASTISKIRSFASTCMKSR